MKTPEQIAADVYWTVSDFPTEPKGSDLRALMATAIKADRAQREFPMSDPVIELREWASTVSQFMAEDKSNDWSEEIAHLQVIEERLDGDER